jgi:lipoprotein-anchoring transpeptidase ErfK/SrfK
LRPAAVPDTRFSSFCQWRRCWVSTAAAAALGLLAAGCSGGSGSAPGDGTSQRGGAGTSAVRLSITPTAGTTDAVPGRGITVKALGGRITGVTVQTAGEPVSGRLNSAATVWHSTWALDVSHGYTVSATATGASGTRVTKTSTFRTLTPSATFSTEIIEGQDQTYGVGMPIILYFSRPIADRAAVERAVQVSSSKPVVGAWYWDRECGAAPVCLYFRPERYWPAHDHVSFTGHLDGVEVAPHVYGSHTLRQTFTIGDQLSVVANTASHYMTVYRNGRLFAHWPISTGRPGDETPDGRYLTIEKANPVDMVGPGYNIEVPWSVRFTWSGDYLHDAYWSVGEQGFTNVSHGCVNMSPLDAEIFYKMADPGDPVTVVGSPRSGSWDNGWTMWFLSWKQWLRGSVLREPVLAGPRGSTLIRPGAAAVPAPRQDHRPRRLA